MLIMRPFAHMFNSCQTRSVGGNRDFVVPTPLEVDIVVGGRYIVNERNIWECFLQIISVGLFLESDS